MKLVEDAAGLLKDNYLSSQNKHGMSTDRVPQRDSCDWPVFTRSAD